MILFIVEQIGSNRDRLLFGFGLWECLNVRKHFHARVNAANLADEDVPTLLGEPQLYSSPKKPILTGNLTTPR
jgi:hypothetical protein